MTSSIVGVHEAKTHLSQLLVRVARGEEVLIARRGQVVARLVPAAAPQRRAFGLDVGRMHVSADFDASLPDDVLAAFES